MSDPVAVAKIELDTLSAFQGLMHLPVDEDEKIISKFSYNFEKTSWSVKFTEKMKSSGMEGGRMTFYSNLKFDFLLYTYLIQLLPALKVNNRYEKRVQICWPHNVMNNILKQGVLRIDDDLVQTTNSRWLDIYSQYYMKSGFRSHHDIMIGNVPFLEEWTDFLPAYPIIGHQPWYYARHTTTALPLFLISRGKGGVTHEYSIRAKLSDILRMRVFNDKTQEWKEIPYNWKYMEAVTETETIPSLEMFGKYTRITDAEREWRKEQPHEVYTEDVITLSSDNESKYGTNVSINLDSIVPVKAIFWVAENKDASENNNFSNYTTNTQHYLDGWNPIKTSSLNYSNYKRVENMDHDHFDRVEPWYNFPSPPSEPGYNCLAMGYDTTTLNADIGVVFHGLQAKLTCKLGNTDPFLSKIIDRRRIDINGNSDLIPEEISFNEITENRNSPNFTIYVFLLVVKRLRLIYNQRPEITGGDNNLEEIIL